MNIKEAQSVLAAVGSEDRPSADQLKQARGVFLEAAKVAKEQRDKVALATMLEAIKASDLAITAAEELSAKEAEEFDAMFADIPELVTAVEPEAPAAPAAAEPVAVLSVEDAIARLGLATGSDDRIEVIESEPVQTLSVLGETQNDASWASLAQAFGKVTNQSLRSGRSTIATFKTEYGTQLSGRQGENTKVLDDLSRRSGESAVVAAGGCCSLAEPIRDIPMLSELGRPIADALPTVGANHGKVTFYAPVCLPQGGAGVWTCADDAAVDEADEATWKDCVEIDCVDPQEVTVEAIYRCLTIGNYQHKFASERWEAILHATAVEQARLAEQTLFLGIANDDATTQHTGIADTGSVYLTLVNTLLRAAAAMRQSQRYLGQRLKAIAPQWLKDAADLDMLARALKAGKAPTAEGVDSVLARAGIDMVWSPDLNPIQGGVAVDGPVLDFPSTAGVVLYVDGGVFRLDGGEINLGTEIRDHDLNRQNKLAAFSESFEAAVVRSCDTKHITIPVTVCDAAPCDVIEP